jgi:hypothetical protein
MTMTAIERVKPLSNREFAALGLTEVAYLRQTTMDGQPGFAIHAANGRMIGFAPNRNTAIEFIRDNNLEPATLH